MARRTVSNADRRLARAARMAERAGVPLGEGWVRKAPAEQQRTRAAVTRAVRRTRANGQ